MPTHSPSSPDLDALGALLADGTQAAFDALRQQHPDEQWYGVALMPMPDWQFPCLMAWGERRMAAGRSDEAVPADPRLAEAERWATGDPKRMYHEQGLPHLDPAIDEIADWYEAVTCASYRNDKAEDAAFADYTRRLIALCEDALRRLDAAGFFGRGEDRSRLLLFAANVFADFDEIIASARRLNPPDSPVLQRMVRHLAPQPIESPPGRPIGKMGSNRGGLNVPALDPSSLCPQMLTPDRRYALLLQSGCNQVGIYGLPEGKQVARSKPGLDPYIWTAAMTPDGTTLVAGCKTAGRTIPGLQSWPIKRRARFPVQNKYRAYLPAYQGQPNQLAFTPDGRTLFIASPQPESIEAWDVETGRRIWAHPYNGSWLHVSPDGTRLAVHPMGRQEPPSILDTSSGQSITTLPLAPVVRDVAWSPDGGRLLVSEAADHKGDGDIHLALLDVASRSDVWDRERSPALREALGSRLCAGR